MPEMHAFHEHPLEKRALSEGDPRHAQAQRP
jgi:hypothetical protein